MQTRLSGARCRIWAFWHGSSNNWKQTSRAKGQIALDGREAPQTLSSNGFGRRRAIEIS